MTSKYQQGSRRRGSVLIYSFYLMTIMFAFVSFGVDFGHLETVKTELQRNADATARGALQLYLTYGSGIAVSYAPYLASSGYNPVDFASGVSPTVSIVWGSYNSSSKVFTPGGVSPIAVKVVISRATVNGNPVKLTFPLMSGYAAVRKTCDVWAQSIAVLDGGSSTTAIVSGQSDPWLAGMPNGSQASDLDTAPAQSPPMAMTVTPGTTITFTNISGGVSHDPADPNDTAAGNFGGVHSHNDDDPLNEPAIQNGIGNIYAPIDSLLGVFLTSNAPNTQTAPTAYQSITNTTAASQATWSNIQLQEPFYIGTGKTGATTQTFIVPQGATQLYLGTMDGHQWSNNSGSFSVTITQQQAILIVQ